MVAVQETIECVKRSDVDQYRYGFETLVDSEKAPKRLSEDTVKFISQKTERAGLDAPAAARSLSRPADHDRADLGVLQRGLPQEEAVGPVVNGLVEDDSSSCQWNSQWKRRS